ncbi:MAG: hypothetical protein ACRDL7_03320, partial [Gaiellaceae bacterium]
MENRAKLTIIMTTMSGMITRARGGIIFNYIFKQVYQIHPELNNGNHPLWRCMVDNGYDNILDILELDDDEIEELAYYLPIPTAAAPGTPDQLKLLPKPDKKTIKYTIWWRNWKAAQSQDGSVDWTELTVETFLLFCQQVVPQLQNRNTSGVQTVTTALQSASITEVHQFQRSIKRDPNVFPTFSGKSDEWFSYNRDLIAQASVQQVERILDLTAVAPAVGSHDRGLWDIQNHFLYSVFSIKLTKGHAAICVRNHSMTLDAHAVYGELHQYYNSTDSRVALMTRYDQRLSSLTWEYNYPGGPTKYVADFRQ